MTNNCFEPQKRGVDSVRAEKKHHPWGGDLCTEMMMMMMMMMTMTMMEETTILALSCIA